MHSKKYVIANWKMNGLRGDLNQISIIDNFIKKKNNLSGLQCIFCLPYTILGIALTNRKLKNIKFGAQDISNQLSDFGPFTGQISSKMLQDLKCKFTIVGHSEKRSNGDNDADISRKIQTASKNHIKVILCVGEGLNDFKSKKSFIKVKRQLNLSLKKNKKFLKNIIIAYEPIWSIGTGIIPNNNYLNNFFYKIKKYLNDEFKTKVTVIYGGSVSSNNIDQLKNINLCDGFLIGGASLKSKNFIDIMKKYYS